MDIEERPCKQMEINENKIKSYNLQAFEEYPLPHLLEKKKYVKNDHTTASESERSFMNFKKYDAMGKIFSFKENTTSLLKKQNRKLRTTHNPTKNINIKIIVHISTTFGPSNK